MGVKHGAMRSQGQVLRNSCRDGTLGGPWSLAPRPGLVRKAMTADDKGLGLVEPPDTAALAQLTNVQGHALLGVRLQLVVVDRHLPLEKQDGQS